MQITTRRFISLSSRPRSRKEFFNFEMSLQSTNQWCWGSSSASVASNTFSPKQSRQKVTKKERSAMVLTFVEKYRALNGGKFPTVSCTKKQVGGSYYVVREIIQELEHNHKRASLETKKEIKTREDNVKCADFSLTKEPCISVDAKQTSFKVYMGDTIEVMQYSSKNKRKGGPKTSRLSIEAHSDNQIEIDAHRQLTPSRVSKESQQDNGFDKLQVSTSPATVRSQTHTSGASVAEAMNVGNQVSATLETRTSFLQTSTEKREVCGKDASSAANLPEEVFRSEEYYVGQRQMLDEQGAQWTNTSKFWVNLKSVAVGIISLWKK